MTCMEEVETQHLQLKGETAPVMAEFFTKTANASVSTSFGDALSKVSNFIGPLRVSARESAQSKLWQEALTCS